MPPASPSGTSRLSIPGRILFAALTALLWITLPWTPGARAEDPVTLSREGQITDKVGALSDREPQVEATLDRLFEEQRVQLFVAYVRDFSGRDAQTWTDGTADRNGLGQDDVLLAVATHDRRYACSVDQGSRLTDARLRSVANTAVEPALRQNDWAGAAIGAADGYAAVPAGEPVAAPAVTPGAADPGGGSGDGASAGLIVPLAVVVVAGAVAVFAFTSRRHRTRTRTTPAAGGWGREAGAEAEPPVPLPELDARAKEDLVDTDDAVRTSEEELGFATAQFGEEATAPFAEAVQHAGAGLTEAFRLRQQLDDAVPEDDATRRRMLDDIISRCTDANTRLDAVSEDFDRLRALEQTAPQAVATAESMYRELIARVAAAETAVRAMRDRYAETAVAPAAEDVGQAKDRLVFATSVLNQARQAVDSDDNARAAVHVRAAEGAVEQVSTLVDAVGRRAGELAGAADRLPAALTGTETDLADAEGLLDGTPQGTPTADLRGRVARAQAVVRAVKGELGSGRYDPVDALRRVEEADAALDEALARAREQDEQERGGRRARSLLDGAMLTARAAIGAAADYISTNRGAVGSQARTRLAEARRRWESAGRLSEADDTQGALAEAQRADALATRARSLAEQDVDDYHDRSGPGGPRGAGGTSGAVLGGIILGGLLGGGRGGFGGGFGGPGGGLGGGPGSFGGGGTRGRRGGGGRY